MLKIDFNSGWKFKKEGGEYRTVQLPHDAMIVEERRPDAPGGSGSAFHMGGIYEYEKEFFLKDDVWDKWIGFYFEGVYQNATVWINGKKAAFHAFGYTGFLVNGDKLLKIGEKNRISVRVDNSKLPNSRWYTGSGIYRPVKLLIAERIHIKHQSIRVTTKSIHTGEIEIQAEIINKSEEVISTGVRFDILDAENKVVNSSTVQLKIENGQRKKIESHVEVKNAKLWTEKTPYLYRCNIYLDGRFDETVRFGIRTISCDSKNGFCINGKEVKLKGACIHSDNGILGAVSYEEADRRKVRLLKDAGYNAIRSAHNPASQAILNACDEYGMYLMDELYDMWYIHKSKYDYANLTEKNWKKDMADMIAQDYNHPSVVMYSIGNEISETAQKQGPEWTRMLTEGCHAMDSTRPVTCCVNLMLDALISVGLGVYKETDVNKAAEKGNKVKKTPLSGSTFINRLINAANWGMQAIAWLPITDRATKKSFAEMDVCGYNYGQIRYLKDKKKYPDRVIVGSETLLRDLASNWKKVKENKHLIGDFVWSAWDYLGEAGVGSWAYEAESGFTKGYPWLLADCGLYDITGYLTTQGQYSKTVFNERIKPVIAVSQVHHAGEKHCASTWRMTNTIECWSFEGQEGKQAEIEVYSAAPFVELKVNGKSLGKKACGESKKYIAHFKTVYQPGNLEAIAYDQEGKVLETSMLCTAGKENILTLSPEKLELCADSQDLCYLNIEITDQNGTIKMSKDTEVTVKVTGAGKLVGLGSANPRTEERYYENTWRTYLGRAQAIIQSTEISGAIHVEVSANGYETKEVTIQVK